MLKLKKCKAHDKDMHPSQRSVIRAAIRCSKRGKPLRYYFHRECRSWHLSSKVRDNGNRRNA